MTRLTPLVLLLAAAALPIAADAASPATKPTTSTTTAPTANPLKPGSTQFRKLDVAGLSRSYLVHVPPSYDPSRPTPIVLAFHGAWMNAPIMALFSGLDRKADAAGFIVVYPNGTGVSDTFRFFNAWSVPGSGGQGPPDDVAFTAAMLDDLATVANVDPKRTFATGMSNGGMMCHRLAAELTDRLAAIAPVAGTLAIPGDPRPTRPVPVLHFHGDADRLVPFAGPSRRGGRVLNFRSVDQTIATWVRLNNCANDPVVTTLPHRSPDDGTTVVQAVYAPVNAGGAEVILVTIRGGGHTWPGRPVPIRYLGPTTLDISANDLIWDFFLRHPMK